MGKTLTATTTGISDADGLAGATFTYRWLAGNTAISGATGRSYTVTDGDAGKSITVQVSFTDDDGNAETLTSAPTSAVTPRALRLQAAAVDGATLTMTYNNDLDEGVTLPASAFTVTVAGNARAVSGASVSGRAVTLTLASEVAAGEAVTVSYTKPDGSRFIRDTQGNTAGSFGGETVTNNTVEPPANNPAIGAPGIDGTAQTGQTLTATTSGIADEDGLTGAAFTHQWVRSDSGTDTDIAAATGSTYVVATADEGKVIRVRVSFTDDLGNSESLISNGVTATAVPDDPEDPIDRRTDPDDDPDPVLAQLTARLSLTPESHNGSDTFAFHVRFSEEPKSDFSYLTMHHHAFTVTGGSVAKVRRLDPPSNAGWEILIQPDANGPVTIVLPATSDCDDAGAVCTEDGRKLSNRLQLTVSGP